MSDLPVWKQLVIALIVVAAMGVGTAVGGMCGGLVLALVAGILIQVVRVAMRPVPLEDEPPGP
jgi:hypothetical protein